MKTVQITFTHTDKAMVQGSGWKYTNALEKDDVIYMVHDDGVNYEERVIILNCDHFGLHYDDNQYFVANTESFIGENTIIKDHVNNVDNGVYTILFDMDYWGLDSVIDSETGELILS